MAKRNNSVYPIQLITGYRAGKISRQQFMKQFSEWQKANTINFDCKGTADKSGVYMTYLGIKATIRNGLLCWKNNTAKSVFEFRRQVDYAFNQEFNAFKNASYYAGEAYEANRRGDTDRLGEIQQKQIYILQQAEKWGALWN